MVCKRSNGLKGGNMSATKGSNDSEVHTGEIVETTPKPGSALANIPPAQLAKLGTWSRWLISGEDFPTVETSDVRQKIQLAMLLAETPEELFKAGNALKLDEIQNVPLTVVAAYPMKSAFPDPDGPGIFMVIDAIRGDTGEEVTIATSAGNVMAAICRAADAGWVQFTFKARRADRATADGFLPFIIESA